MQKLSFLLFICATLFFCSSCKEEQIPAFLHIESFDLNTQDFQGSASHKITDVWVFIDGNLIGGYALPATIPVLKEGTSEVFLDPGIRESGIIRLQAVYPFYNRMSFTHNFVAGQTDTIVASTSYKSEAKFTYIEDFNSSHLIKDDLDGDEETEIIISNQNAFEGNIGLIELDTAHNFIEVATLIQFDSLPTLGTPVYLELNYYSEAELAVGLIGNIGTLPDQKAYPVVFVAKEEWNKVYINLTTDLQQSQLDNYRLLFTSICPADRDEANVYLDNIKLIHF